MDPLILIAGFILGFIVGLATYAHLYSHFLLIAERKAAVRAQMSLNAERLAKTKADEVRKKIVSQYGNDLSQKHIEVIDEEVERVLSGGPK